MRREARTLVAKAHARRGRGGCLELTPRDDEPLVRLAVVRRVRKRVTVTETASQGWGLGRGVWQRYVTGRFGGRLAKDPATRG